MNHRFWRTASKIVVFGLLATHLTGTVWAQSGFSSSSDSNAVIVRYTRTPGELEAPDSSTTTTIYASGRTLVHFSPYGARKGDYELTLSRAELKELIASLVDNGLLEYDHDAVDIEKQAIMEVSGMGFYTSDADISSIEIELASYSPEGAATRYNVRKDILVSALQMEARHFPSIEPLGKLAAAERQLIKLIDRDDLRPLR
jgi:hypothetical protein